MKTIVDEEFGEVFVNHSPRATRYGIKIKGDMLILVVPYGGTVESALLFLRQKAAWVRNHRKRVEKRVALLDETTDFRTLTFSLRITFFGGRQFHYTLREGVLTVLCPDTTDVHSEESQTILRRIILGVMKSEAKRYLPERLAQLAARHGFVYNRCSVRASRSRWGSCSTSGTISLSLFLMLLPAELVDYVLLHELCHTREMNHGEAFWHEMNCVTDGKAQELRNRMREYKPCF